MLIKHIGFTFLFLFSSVCLAQKQDSAPINPPDFSHVQNAIPRPLPLSPYGNPAFYEVNGKTYHVLKSANGYEATGFASWYGTKFNGKRTSSGEPYNMYAMTAASPTLPIPSFVEVVNLQNKKSIIVKVNDRGPFHDGRILDLSYAAATKLDILQHGTAHVRVIAIDTGTIDSHIPSHFLQVAAFTNNTNAKSFIGKLQTVVANQVSLTSKKIDKQDTIYRVLIGPVNTTQLASLQNTLTQHGYEKGFLTQG